jgi:hypothetical protein
MKAAGGWRLIGLALLLPPFLPLPRIFGPIPGSSGLVSAGDWLARTAALGLGAWLFAFLLGSREWPAGWKRSVGLARPGVALLLIAAALAAVSAMLFQGHPLHLDSIVQLFHAQVFAAGQWTAPRPPGDAFFFAQNMILDETGWYSQYAPGQPALLAPGARFLVPWIMPLALSIGTALLLYRFTKLVYGARPATIALFLIAASPFFWFMGASFMNHVPALFFTSLTIYSVARWERKARATWLAAAGAALGAVFLVRPLTALAIGLALAPFVVARTWTGREATGGARWGQVAVGALTFGVTACLYLAYNGVTTGDPLTPGYLHLWGDGHGLGFHATPWGDEHTPWLGLRNQLTDLSLLGVYLFESPLSGLLPVAAFFSLGWSERGWDRRLLLAFLAIPAAYFFYWHRDDYLGPRFLYSTLALVLPLTARSLEALVTRLADVDLSVGSMRRAAPGPVALGALIVLSLVYAVLWGIPQRARWHTAGREPLKVDLVAEARTRGIDNALIFVSVSWGNRLIARLRGAGVPASLVERAYRSVDHCVLHETLDDAGGSGADADRLGSELQRLILLGEDLVATPHLNGDRTLRLNPTRELSPGCIEEINHDRQGYGLYTPHVRANRPALDGPFVVARDLRGLNPQLQAHFPEFPAYRYRAGTFSRLP